jgi:hypothetical protein
MVCRLERACEVTQSAEDNSQDEGQDTSSCSPTPAPSHQAEAATTHTDVFCQPGNAAHLKLSPAGVCLNAVSQGLDSPGHQPTLLTIYAALQLGSSSIRCAEATAGQQVVQSASDVDRNTSCTTKSQQYAFSYRRWA